MRPKPSGMRSNARSWTVITCGHGARQIRAGSGWWMTSARARRARSLSENWSQTASSAALIALQTIRRRSRLRPGAGRRRLASITSTFPRARRASVSRSM